MQVTIRSSESFGGLSRAAHRIGRFFDRAIRRLEDRHRGELPYMRQQDAERDGPSVATLRADAESAALPAALAGLRSIRDSASMGDKTGADALKTLADDMASLTAILQSLSETGRPAPAETRREPVWASGLAVRFKTFAKLSDAVAARQQHETDKSNRGQANGQH